MHKNFHSKLRNLHYAGVMEGIKTDLQYWRKLGDGCICSSTKKFKIRKLLLFLLTFFLLPCNHQIIRHQPASLLTPPTLAACQAPLQPITTILFPSPTSDLLGLQTTETGELQTAGKQISQASAGFQACVKPADSFVLQWFPLNLSFSRFSNRRVWSGLSPSNIVIFREQLAPVQCSQWHLGSARPSRYGGLLSCAYGEPEGMLD